MTETPRFRTTAKGWMRHAEDGKWVRHMLGVVHHRTKHIEAVPWQDVPALYADLCRMPNVSALAARWAVLTLVRSMAVRGARFDEIDGDVWTVPAARVKGKRGNVSDFRVPLSPEANVVQFRKGEK